VEEPELHAPFEQPVLALDDMAKFRTSTSLGERLHVKGVVTLQRPGLDLFIQDETGGLHLESLQSMRLPLSRPIEAVGFLEIVNYQPILRDAVYRETGVAGTAVIAKPVPMSELREGLHGAELIVLRGTLLDRSVREVRREDSGFVGVRTICTIRHPEQSFTAEYEGTQESAAINAIPLGSLVELQGVASMESGDDGKLKALTLFLPEPKNIRVIESPSWFTSERLLIGFGVVCGLLAAVVMWLMTITKKNEMLKFLVAEREKAQKELQEAHDLLEVRVKERTEQLKVEMTVRKTAELEFRAVLTERTRLARELHDTLEQALTGIALQLDTASKLFQRNPAEASQPLELARGFLRQSQIELRRSIWDLRSRELEQFDLTQALSIASRQISAGSRIAIEVDTVGERKRLPEIVEENLLRIAQEAVTNVVKHSGATLVTIRLTFGADTASLEIKDNGSGLNADRIAARSDHQFGLLGMSERAKRLNGRLDVSSTPGEGTTVRAIISLIEEVTPTAQP
jgi:signal transduction histidine kinase